MANLSVGKKSNILQKEKAVRKVWEFQAAVKLRHYREGLYFGNGLKDSTCRGK
ncbi:hypothetical protein AVEN_88181-1, partial [Araneus ventricosus]